MRINEVAKITGLSADTIRFYEKEGIVPSIDRDANGHRVFSANNVTWMTILYWLRKTGMPMDVMSRFALLVHDGDHTIPERLDILTAHSEFLARRREELDQCEALLAHKIGVYRGFEKRETVDDK
ncbi:MAG: MerR family transcriptional regulator [Litoreibacter sp.]